MSTIHPEAGMHTGSSNQSFGTRTSGRHGVDERSMGEGPVARLLEEQTSRLPSDTWLWAAGLSIIGSLFYQSRGCHHKALFVGQWAPTFLLLGIYNKLVKLHGSE